MSLLLFESVILLYAVGAIGALLLRKKDTLSNWWGNGFAMLGSVAALALSASILISGSSLVWQAASTNAFLFLSVSIDRLSACFIGIISLIAFFSSVYSIGYSAHHYQTDAHRIGLLGFFYNIFLAGMILVVTAHQGLYFLVVWEVMSLASYFLVIFEGEKKENQKAGLLYFVMTHAGTAFLMVAFLLLYRETGSFDFDVIRAHLGNVSGLIRDIVFVLCLIGFGTKAGMIPLHVWLPKAHPAAPSFVSALMSGVMIKTGIYMMIRIAMDLMPSAPLWWGILVIVIGAYSTFLGALYSLTEGDMKKMLAYCSIENVGIIMIGLGASMVFWSLRLPSLAIIALAASFFHTLNHAIYKALLFFCAGSVISATHTRNMESYGGLIKRMPVTSACFLVGAMAISALPPFNGFFSEWMTLQSLFEGVMNAGSSLRWIFILAISALAFAGGLAAATFVKAFGISFLARPRTKAAEHAKESSISLRIGMIALAVLTVLIGLFSRKIAGFLYGIAGERSAFQQASTGDLTTAYLHGASSISLPWIFVALSGTLLVVWITMHLVLKKRSVNYHRTWDCGTTLGPRMEMTPMAFSRTMILIFKGVLRPTRHVEDRHMDEDADRYFASPGRVQFGLKDVYQSYLYGPIQKCVSAFSELLKAVQNGNVNTYVTYILLTILALLFATKLF